MEVETMLSLKSRKENTFYKLTFQAKVNEQKNYCPKMRWQDDTF